METKCFFYTHGQGDSPLLIVQFSVFKHLKLFFLSIVTEQRVKNKEERNWWQLCAYKLLGRVEIRECADSRIVAEGRLLSSYVQAEKCARHIRI